MIQLLLSTQDCAGCKGCCNFYPNEIWEAPMPLSPPNEANLSFCVHLNENGCKLGHNKPLECTMYPFRVMRLGGFRVLALSRFCKPIKRLPLNRIVQFAEDKSAEFFALADKHPEIVKEYSREYIILKIKNYD